MSHISVSAIISLGLMILPLKAFNIEINYKFDTNNFFDPETVDGAAARAALEAAAARYSEIITTSLSPVVAGNPVPDTDPDWRLGFTHPGTGANFEISAAPSVVDDDLIGIGAEAADLYDPNFSIAADTWILFAGGRSLSVAGDGGTGSGTNFLPALPDFPGVFLVDGSHLNRDWKGSGATYSQDSLPVWGGSISFDNDGTTDWHFDINTVQATGGQADFYSVAVHEIGHALGLSVNWTEFTDLVSGSAFTGAEAIAALDADNGTTGTAGISLVSSTNFHFQDGAYQSFPFGMGSAPAPGVNGNVLQDLVLEPTANFDMNERRFDLTNVEVAALRDIGWQTITDELPSTLTEWRVAFGDDTANPSGDGMNNLIKYAFGLDPMNAAKPDEVFYSTVESVLAEGRYLSLNIPRKLVRPGISYTVEASNDQVQWDSGSGHTVILEESPTMWRVRDAVAVEGAAPRRFLRFRVTAL
ncbi:MAG: hypothetical protein ACI8T1_005251 [Verrucomicrobiales bacterium]|jgi:hypothetical protein